MNTKARLSIERQAGFADGFSFGDAGPYERLTGSAFFELDPGDPANANVVDLELAPSQREWGGRVQGRPRHPETSRPGARQRLPAVRCEQPREQDRPASVQRRSSPDNDPLTTDRRGQRLPDAPGLYSRLVGLAGRPRAGRRTPYGRSAARRLENGAPVRGRVRQEFIAEQEGVLWMPLSGAPSIRSYPALDLDTSHRGDDPARARARPARTSPARCLGVRGGGDGRWRAAGAPLPHGLLRGRRSQTRLDIRAGLRNGGLPHHGTRHRGHPRPRVHAPP